MKIQVKDISGKVLASAEGSKEVKLVYNEKYQNGDKLIFDFDYNKHLWVNIGEYVVESLIYAPESKIEYSVPFGKKLTAYHPEAFKGNFHEITVRIAEKEELSKYRNLALNGLDKHQVINYYPHAYANVVTRNEPCFEPRNAIDGCKDNSSHGDYPYHSWGGGLRDDLEFILFFGREVRIDKIVLYLRADYNNDHDTNWETGVFEFSDGSRMPISMIKTAEPQSFKFDAKVVTFVRLIEIKRPNSAAFAALTAIEVYGIE